MAQIAMLRRELVDEEKWISSERFNRVLSVYQLLPGPEAHELTVYFGMLRGGRLGGLLAGLGFMLPGFVLMFTLSWIYVTYGMDSPVFAATFYGCKAAVVALIIRAIQRIGAHALTDRWLWGIAIGVAAASLLGLNFVAALALAGVAYWLARSAIRSQVMPAMLPLVTLMQTASAAAPSLPALFGYGLRSGLLTFGGAYTVIPFLQHDAVVSGGWMTNAQFLDGLALSGILPAPLVIFATFVGYLGGGPLGAVALTAGVFLPAFAFTLVGHRTLEALVENTSAHAFLDGVTAGVVGLVTVTALGLFREAIFDIPTALILALALIAIYVWKSRFAVVGIMFGAGLLGWMFAG